MLAQVDQLQAAAAELVDDTTVLDAGDDDELGEANTANVERDRLLALAQTARRSLAGIDAALGRIEAGTYGRCAGCGAGIPAERLAVVPDATHCVACKSCGLRLRRPLG